MAKNPGQSVERKKSPGKKAEPTLFDLLKEDHDRVRSLFQQIESMNKKERDAQLELFSRMEDELKLHMEGEERFLYTALERHEEARDKVLQFYEEHRLARLMLGAFNSLALDDERWYPKVAVLKKYVVQHLEAEESELFVLAKKMLGKDQIATITEQVLDLKAGSKRTEGTSSDMPH